MRKPKVSIVCITYNQEKYIAQAIDSFLMQQSNFSYEIIIADDASTDGTQEIIKKYATAYPDKIVPVLRKQNIGVGENLKSALTKARGTYVATCEGDDYWTNPEKLQLQVDFLDARKGYALCFHTTKVIYEDGDGEGYEIPLVKKGFSLSKLLMGNYIHTSSVMYRRGSYHDLPVNMLPIDWYIHLQHAKEGKIGFINKTMSVYRRNKDSVWFPIPGEMDDFWIKRGVGHAAMFEAVHNLFAGTRYMSRVEETQDRWTQHLVELDIKYNAGLITDLCDRVPEALSRYVQKNANESLRLKQELERKNSEIELMKQSVFWRSRNKIVKFLGREAIYTNLKRQRRG